MNPKKLEPKFKVWTSKCHFTEMVIMWGEYNESWLECKHCGHTKQLTPPHSYER